MTLIRHRIVSSVLLLGFFAGTAFGQAPKEKAWQLLQAGAADKSTENRALAIRVLGLLSNEPIAVKLAEEALTDEKPEVRSAAALALGGMGSKASIPQLRQTLTAEKESAVVMAAAASLKGLGDPMGYEVYYAILTGERKSGSGLLDDQKKMLKDPKKMAQFGFEQGIGFVPFAGLGLTAVKTFTKDDTSPVRAGAAKALATDPDPRSSEALVQAVSDESWIVRTVALDSIAQRGDPALLPKITRAMDDDKAIVRFTAAAAVVRLASLTHEKR
jgi:HEAT repeat protein